MVALTPIAPADADRLAKLAGMLASDQDGERASAALLATRQLSRMGLTWRDLVERAATSTRSTAAYARSAPPPAPAACDGMEMLSAILARRSLLNPWELEFADSLLRQRRVLSEKQRAVLMRLHARVVRAGAA